MDSVIVFFGKASYDEVESQARSFGFSEGTVTRNETHFFLSRYSQQQLTVELDSQEQDHLRLLLRSAPESAFAVSARHGRDARFALEVVSELMSQLAPAVLDDDYGNVWNAVDLTQCFQLDGKSDIYTLRKANSSFDTDAQARRST